MTASHFLDLVAKSTHARQELRARWLMRPGVATLELLPDYSAEELERAVEIDFPTPALETPNKGVGPSWTIASGNVGALFDSLEQMVQLAHVELPVTRADEDQIEPSGVAAIGYGLTVHDSQRKAGRPGANVSQDTRRITGHDDDLEAISDQALQDGGKIKHSAVQVIAWHQHGRDAA